MSAYHGIFTENNKQGKVGISRVGKTQERRRECKG